MSSDAHSNPVADPLADPLALQQPVPSLAGRLRAWARAHTTLVSLPLVLLALEAAIALFDIPNYVVPPPHEILTALMNGFMAPVSSRSAFYLHIAVTAGEALSAFVLGSALGIGMGALVVQSPFARRLILPYVIGLQSVPKVALAPLFVVWFGLGLSSKIVLGVLLTFFPLMVNTAAGLASVDRDRLELMQSLDASRWKTFTTVRFPSALPFIFAGLEMAAVYSVLGAVVGEFVGGQAGLGVLILSRNATLDISGSIAALVLLAFLGLGLQKLVALVRRRVLFWAPSPDALRAND
ncbi:MAG: ABC transporter permease [Variibacter sp.]|nr:ABC transporter permease [Variibacter sp.]